MVVIVVRLLLLLLLLKGLSEGRSHGLGLVFSHVRHWLRMLLKHAVLRHFHALRSIDAGEISFMLARGRRPRPLKRLQLHCAQAY